MSPAPFGQVFTPADFATRLAELAFRSLGAVSTSPVRVIDPAAGDGALIAAVLDAAAARGVQVDATAIELDPQLCVVLRRRFGDRVRVIEADALSLVADPPAVACLGGPSPRLVATQAPDLFADGRFDLVIANPPYLRETGNAQTFRTIRAFAGGVHALLYRKDADLHHFFWPLALRLTRLAGVVAMLTPAYVFDSAAAAPVRELAARSGRVLGLWRAGSARVFANASVEAGVTIVAVGEEPGATEVLDAALCPTGRRVTLTPAARWSLAPLDAPRHSASATSLGDVFAVHEGVSTGADTVSARNAARAPDAAPGTGIFVLTAAELAAHGLSDAERERWVRRIHHATRTDWLLWIRDRDLPALDAGADVEPDAPAISAHLRRFEHLLRKRAELARNPRRSWYAVAWPRPVFDRTDLIVTPKWAREPSFSRLGPGAVAMTDHRVLVPHRRLDSATVDALVALLNSGASAPPFEQTLKRRGPLLEFYGRDLLDVRLPFGEIAGLFS